MENTSNDSQVSISNSAEEVKSVDSTNKSLFTPKTHQSRRKYFLAVAVVFIVILLICGFILKTHKSHNLGNSRAANKIQTSISTDHLTTQYIKLPASVLTAQTGTDGGYLDPYDVSSQANGHYLYINSSNGQNSVIYDGKTVYSSSSLIVNSELLSDNGLHYTFAVLDGNNYQPFIDGKRLSYDFPASSQSNITQVPKALSNDGTTLVYDYRNSAGDDSLYTNGSLTLKLEQLSGVEYDDNASNYILINDENSGSEVILNGKTTTPSNLSLYGYDTAISQNGQHYAYLYRTGQSSVYSLFVDGKNLGTVKDPWYLGITNTGDYYYLDGQNASLYINKQEHKLDPKYISDSQFSNGSGASVLISSNGQHYLVVNNLHYDNGQGYANLDGKVIDLPKGTFQAEFDNNFLYIYLAN